jgi:hypothetical protein
MSVSRFRTRLLPIVRRSSVSKGAVLLDKVWELKKRLRCSIPDLTVLSRQKDPYCLSDGRAGQWFAEQVGRFIGLTGTVHLRGLFYLCVSAGDVRRPSGKNGLDEPFVNNEDCWEWLGGVAAKNARGRGRAAPAHRRD